MGNSIDRGVEVISAGSTSGLPIDGNVAHHDPDAGNPVKVGGKASNALPAAVDNGDRVDAYFDLNGVLHVYDENGASAAAGDVAHDDPDSGNPVKVGGKAYNALPAPVGNGDRVNAYFDLNGVLHVYDENGSSAAAGDVAHDGADSGNPVKIGGRARSSQIAAVANNDRTDFIANLYGEQIIAGYDWVTGAVRTSENSPLSEHYVNEKFYDENITTNTTNYVYFDMNGYRYFTLQGIVARTTDHLTVTVWATTQDDGTAPASCDYEDVTNELFGVANWYDTNFMAICDNVVGFKFIRVKYVTSNDAGNDVDLTLHMKKLW